MNGRLAAVPLHGLPLWQVNFKELVLQGEGQSNNKSNLLVPCAALICSPEMNSEIEEKETK